jgi:hypothetical protein
MRGGWALARQNQFHCSASGSRIDVTFSQGKK